MPVTDVQQDLDNLTLTITAEFAAPVERIWQIYADPRQLEKVWGPPTYPATVVEHDLAPGGTVTYYMTGPEGDQHHGWWRVRTVDAPSLLEFEDGFADEHGTPNSEMPTTVTRVTLTESEAGVTDMQIVTTFPSPEAMEQMVAMGMEEGITAAVGQIDELIEAHGVR